MMKAAISVAAGFALLAGALAYMRRAGTVAQAEGEAGQEADADGIELNIYRTVQDMIAPIDIDQAETNTAAFLMTIRDAEGTAGPDGYRTLFGGSLFDDFSDHPRVAKQFRTRDGRQLYTSAAGAYQFMAVSPIPGGKSTRVNTWDVVSARLGLPDFGPDSQDAAAIELIREAGALGDVRAGRFDDAVRKVRGIWASLPGAGYGQPERSIERLRMVYLNSGGYLA